MIVPINKFLFVPRLITPLAFDESMSYYEQLCALLFKQKEIIEKLNNYDEAIKTLNNNLNQLNDTIFNILQRLTNLEANSSINLINPLTNQNDNLQNILNLIASKLCNCEQTTNEKISAFDFDSLELTCTNFDSLEINANNFDNQGKTILSNLNIESEV